MADKCEFCGQSLVDGVCVNPECDLSDFAPAISDRADLSEDTFLPDLDLDDDLEMDLDEFLPETSKDSKSTGDSSEQPGDLVRAAGPEVSDEIAQTLDSSDLAVGGPALSNEPKGGFVPEFSDSGVRGLPLLSLEQAAIPVDHTGTILFEGTMDGVFRTQTEVDENATRLTDDDNYRVIRTVLRESVSESSEEDVIKEDETGKAKGALTGRPEVSRTIRVQNPAETHRTVLRLPGRDLSVPSDSASLEKRKKRAESDDYNLDSKDYTIVDKVGEGGSGVVYKARQVALHRTVALKVLKQRRMQSGSRSRTRTKELEKRKGRFLHEVHVTAKLQHPNIIPLYDLGMNAHGEVFYSMKLIDESSAAGEEVQQSWASMVRVPAKKITPALIEKNVAIFDKVCDAMRYAHAEKIVHRDLKPDNVMVGQFGEVLVIDWGMALDLSKGPQPFTAGGTTSYMPPEMGLHYLKQSEMHKLSHKLMIELGEARREVYVESVLDGGTAEAAMDLLNDPGVDPKIHEMCHQLMRLDTEEEALAKQINYSSDIYLLGAILYEIAVGHPPHFVPQDSCKNIEEKHHREFWLSSNHRIQRLVQITDPLRLSLCNIALKALQKEQQDRYQSVDELKEAIRGFNRQVQSLQLEATGRESLEKAKGGEGYLNLLPALESFRGAQSLWPEGVEAKKLQTETACEYARRADIRKDFDAGLSILDEYTTEDTKHDPHVVTLVSKLEKGKKIAARNRRLATVGWVAAVILPIGVFAASWWGTQLLREKNTELVAQADKARKDIAEAETQKDAAVLAQQAAELAAKEAELAAKEADAAKATALATAADAREEADKAQQAMVKAKKDVQDAQAEKQALSIEVADAQTKLEEAKIKVADADKKAAQAQLLANDAERKADEAKQRESAAQLEVAAAEKKIADAEKQVEQLRASSSADQYKALLLPIPLDIRQGKLEQARQQLEKLRNSKLSPQFKNGWLARHFAKVVDVKGVETKLGDHASVIDVLHGPDGSLVVVGLENGQPTVWQADSKTGKATPVHVELPDYGRISHAAISPDGQWLALALDDVLLEAGFREQFWLANLATGRRAWLPTPPSNPDQPSEENNSVVGCKLIGFVESETGKGLTLVTVEELSSYFGLKQRLQIASRDVSVRDQSLVLGRPKTTPLNSTKRDLSRVDSIAAIGRVRGRTAIAIVYSSLDDLGRDKIVMQSLVSDAEGKFAGRQVEVGRFPTAIHVGSSGQFYCGYADGLIDQYSVDEVTEKPVHSNNEQESPVTILASTQDGEVISGSRAGVIVLFDDNLNPVKRLVGQADGLTSVSIAESDSPEGFQLASGGAEGYVRVWNPEGTLHDAEIQQRLAVVANNENGTAPAGDLRLGGDIAVTCGAVDQDYAASEVPATAYGTADGRVFYFKPDAMRTNEGVREIPSGMDGLSKVSIAPPPGSFDSTFDNFDSFGVIGDQFVLMQSDGKLFSTTINAGSRIPSGELGLTDATAGKSVDRGFVPVLAAQVDQGFFFTNCPTNDSQILRWKKIGQSKFQAELAGDESGGRIKRMSLSPDGNWLAVVREVSRSGATGEYITEMYEVRGENPEPLRLASKTSRYRVGDPAFVGFSADSQQIVLHFHKLGVDRETWIENWLLKADGWEQSEPKRKIDDRRVDLIAWDGRDVLVTKINNRFYLTDESTDSRREIGDSASSDTRIESTPNAANRTRLRGVRPTGLGGSQFVLFNESLARYTESASRDTAVTPFKFRNARDVRVFGSQAIVLDDDGFHLVDSDLNYVTMIARRKISTQSLALSKDRLAISYDVGGLCRIMDVSATEPVEVGRFDRASQVTISADGKWAACRRGDQLQVFEISKSFEGPVFKLPMDSEHWAMQWLGTNEPKLLVGAQANDGAGLSWKEIDPQAGQVGDSNLKLPAESGSTGNLIEFKLAPISQKYLALATDAGSTSQFALWAISPDAVARLLGKDEGLSTDELRPYSVSFSEIDQPDKNEIGTRMVVLAESANPISGANAKTTKIFLLSDKANTDQDQADARKLYWAFEIEGMIDVTDGRKLIDSEFSGDGRTLLEVDERGLKILLSEDW